MFNNKHILAIFLAVTLLSVASAQQLSILSLQRQLILNGLYPLEQTFVQFEGEDHLDIFKHIVPTDLEQKIRSIVFSKSRDGKDPLPFTQQQYIFNGQKYALYKVHLDESFNTEQKGQIYITTNFLNRYINFPQEITMNEDQKFQIYDNKYFLSPYPVRLQTTTYKFEKLINHDKDGEVKGLGNVMFRKQNAEPFSFEKHVVHGVNNKPQVYLTNVERIIEVSHWGNIAITQFYSLKNEGPSLKGQFSRVTFGSQGYQDSISAKNAFRGIEGQLPYDVWGLYFRDEVGNISTSKAFRDDYQNKVKFALVPRFSLLGQWKSNWEIGYNLPTKNFLYHQGDKYQLDNIALQYTLERIVAENYNFKIILPEGARNVKVKVGGKQLSPTRVEKNFGYLDFFGRPTFVFQNYEGSLKKKDITVDYELDKLSTVYKPIVIFVIFFSFLVVIIVVRRLKFEAFKSEKTL